MLAERRLKRQRNSEGARRSPKGFSLIELLIAVSIISFLGVVIYSALSQGLKIWKRTTVEKPEINVELMLEKFASDLRNASNNSIGRFAGEEKAVRFLVLGTSLKSPENEGGIPMPYQVRYEFDAGKGIFRKVQTDYRDLLYQTGEKAGIEVEKINLKDCRIRYYYYNAEENSAIWKSLWQEECLPRAVKIDMGYSTQYGVRTVTKTIAVPANYCQAKG
ncbi:MAG: hypothetical protein A3G33_02855 [Omnitrophica bacterium RIFCSPLOWO2_12_FULL_44_17]|uniref:Type II secretion system protein J n=1 Tax=Candidatus Danuiimicrobium aquiferis TaxID=1801832 RepID=A0A1G1KVD8_9BACT|nr:MAG: hypothetical protein A3B72_04335 [Omnitrophica bacterium RIFCSPHIGHO2_02_FULL_45_28]OGW92587.1 MAG: hypothetical protein A3E74_09695 [Omnitrophica bacterium RIFCSPHIGHO2_12_FULL_44_12]OGW96918.1 MAG: hypothetical protein A3G33_02855 [Omnitrophica bacterium RIFCSPLOWO2_12_FULL_44_17]OGX01825.1 MAG: hypothetical protein A3J12_01700 [Omnitrophica bacterium RIFCSPLOWO2_02_FULL_44_11]